MIGCVFLKPFMPRYELMFVEALPFGMLNKKENEFMKVLLAWACVSILLCLSTGLAAGEAGLQPQWAYRTEYGVQAVAISEDGSYVVAASGDTLYFFSSEDSEPLWSFTVGSIQAISMTPDARLIAVATGYDTYRVYLLDRDGNEVWEYHLYEKWQGELPSTRVDDVAISADGKYVAAVGSYSVNLFSADGQRLWYRYGNPDDPIDTTAVAISADGGLIAVGDENGVLSLFETDGTWLGAVDVSPGGYGVEDIAVSGDGGYVAAVAHDSLILVDSGLNRVWGITSVGWDHVVMTPDASRIVATNWDSGTYSFTATSASPEWGNPELITVNSVAISPDGKYVVAGANDGVYLIDGASGEVLGTYPTTDIVEAVDVGRGGYAVAGLYTKQVLLFAPNTPPELRDPQLTPLAGGEGTEFTYRVTYRDPDGDAPKYVRVNIDGTPHDMVMSGGSYGTGAVFEFKTTLPIGTHTYFFEAQDTRGGVARLPQEGGTYTGPTVVAGGEGAAAPKPPGAGIPAWSVAIAGAAAAVTALIIWKLRTR